MKGFDLGFRVEISYRVIIISWKGFDFGSFFLKNWRTLKTGLHGFLQNCARLKKVWQSSLVRGCEVPRPAWWHYPHTHNLPSYVTSIKVGTACQVACTKGLIICPKNSMLLDPWLGKGSGFMECTLIVK